MKIAPSILINGPGFFRQQVESIPEAIEFLEQWPRNARSPFWYLARNALDGALTGSMPTDHARDAFEAFCKESGILLV
jgi:hypothetical protein